MPALSQQKLSSVLPVAWVISVMFFAFSNLAIAHVTSLISLSNDGSAANDNSYKPSIYSDGRYIAFSSLASNLVNDDTNGVQDIFVHDRSTGVTTRVSVSSTGAEGNDESNGPLISADGRFVVYLSTATNLVDNDLAGRQDVFVYDSESHSTVRISRGLDGQEANDNSIKPSISESGRYITFSS